MGRPKRLRSFGHVVEADETVLLPFSQVEGHTLFSLPLDGLIGKGVPFSRQEKNILSREAPSFLPPVLGKR